jgi:hypothetical protein
MTSARMVIGVVCCFAAAIGLVWKTLARPIPAKGELKLIEGEVRDVASGIGDPKTRGDSYPVIHIVGRIGAYCYLGWFPRSDRIRELIKPGDRIRFLSDTPDGNRWVWEIEKDGAVVVSYDEVRAAVSANRGIDPYLAGALFFAGAFGTFRIVRSRNMPNKAPEPTPGSVTPRATKVSRNETTESES